MAVPAARLTMIALLVIGGLNTAISLFYYLRVVKVMTLDDERDSRPPASLSLASIPGAYVALITAPVFALGLFWDRLYEMASNATATLFG
jgi:NADH-quinone oxidoreductase subunit N